MKHIKHWLATMAVLLCSIAASAHDFEVNGIYYNITSSTDLTVAVTYRGSGQYSYSNEYTGTVTIPSIVTYDGVPYCVTSIGEYAFCRCSSLTDITIPESVTTIGSRAFEWCTGLTAITIPNGVTTIEEYAFNCSNLTAITLPESVTSIDASAFSGTVWYNNQPNGEVYIDKVLYGYKGEMPANSSIEVKEGTVVISDCAFYSYTTLTAITLPESVMSIGKCAFYECSSLVAVTIPENSKLALIGGSAFHSCASLTSITLPESLTSIGDVAFYRCSSLADVTIPENSKLASIGETAFYGCNFTSITLPESVKNIGEDAFRVCKNLTSIIIPEGVTSIPSYAFLGCSSLTSVIIPEGVTNIGFDAFYGCSSLATITCNAATPPTIKSGTFYDVDESIALYVPETAISAYQSAEYWKNFTNYQPLGYLALGTCGDNLAWKLSEDGELTIEGTGAMADYRHNNPSPWSQYSDDITKLVIREGVTSIGNYAFYNCHSLTSATLPEGMTSIGNYAFSLCTGLTSITLPESVTDIGTSVFDACISLTSINIPQGVTWIGSSIFNACSSLTSINIPEGVTSIGVQAFRDCNSLKKVQVSSIEAWCKISFGDIYSNPLYYGGLYFNGEFVTELVIPEGVTSIGNYAFENCNSFTSVTIPEGVASIGKDAFSNCSRLTAVHVNSLEAWYDIVFANENSNPLYYAHNLYLEGELVTELMIAEDVTSIGNYAFSNCGNLTAITCRAIAPPTIGANTFNGVDKSIPLYVFQPSIPAYQSAIGWGDFTNIIFIIPETQPLTINRYGSGTYCSEYALDFSEVEGLKAYAATGFNSSTGVVTLSRVKTAKAGVGLFIKGEPGNYVVPVMEDTDDNTLNMLVGTSEAVTMGRTSEDGLYVNYKYTLSGDNATPQFYVFDDGFTLGAGKAYLQVPAAWVQTEARSISLRFDDGETTKIENSKLRIENSTVIFDLMGRRVETPVKGGVYIVNGKKVIW